MTKRKYIRSVSKEQNKKKDKILKRDNDSNIICNNWTSKEDDLLVNLTNIVGCKWKFISKYFHKKSLSQIYNRYSRINPNIKKGRFTREEDDKLMELIKNHGYDWKKIAKEFKNLTIKQIRTRFKLYLSKNLLKNK